MEEKKRALMDQYLKVLAKSTGKEIDNIRAKMAWVLTEELFNEELDIPLSFEEIATLLNGFFLQEFPFCQKLDLRTTDNGDIIITINDCYLKQANDSFENNEGYSLCPIDPFLIFTLSRSLGSNIWFVDVKPTTDGCMMNFSLKNQCGLRKSERG